MTDPDLVLLTRAAGALGLGLLVGLERGWEAREGAAGSRVAGIRTFALLGLGGALWWQIGTFAGETYLGLSFLAVTSFLAAFYLLRARSRSDDFSVTSLTAAVLTFMLGALAMHGESTFAAAAAVAMTMLLGLKAQMHTLLLKVERHELMAVLKLLVMTVILLPVLPNTGYGPFQALNPYVIWLTVILIAGIAFVGYISTRIFGGRLGILIASLAGGLVSSTVVTLTWSRLMRNNPAQWRLFAGGIIVACAVMFLRVLVLAAVIAPQLLPRLGAGLVLAAFLTFAGAAVILRRQGQKAPSVELTLENPFELGMALRFGALLAAMMVLVAVLQNSVGDAGLYILALVGGTVDVDAATASFARSLHEGLSVNTGSLAIAVAIASNSLFKSVVAYIIGGKKIGLAVTGSLLIATAAGAGLVYLALP